MPVFFFNARIFHFYLQVYGKLFLPGLSCLHEVFNLGCCVSA